MPRARCHWSLLVQTREALRAARPAAYEVVSAHRGEFFAGGVAPDALRLFAGHDKPSTHFYDDQRRDTWGHVVATLCAAHPSMADPGRHQPATHAWMLGYLTHVMTDIAYWRHILARLPPFPEQGAVHYGAWMLADLVEIGTDDQTLNVAAVRFAAAPPWVEAEPVRRMLDRLTGGILGATDPISAELAYWRRRPEAHGQNDAQLLAERGAAWEHSLAAARALLPAAAWRAFHEDALQGAVQAIADYLASDVTGDATGDVAGGATPRS